MIEEVRRRLIERHCAATIRALSANPGAEFKRQTLFLNGRTLSFHVPHLLADVLKDSFSRNRGVADCIALRLINSNLLLHQSLFPREPVARLAFDILEQLRCEALLWQNLVGIQRNIDEAFDQWCRQSRGNGLVENELGLLIYSLTWIVRSRLTNRIQDEEVEGLIESVRFRLAPVIGDDLVMLKKRINDQQEYARHALNIAQAVNVIALSIGGDMIGRHLAALRDKTLLPSADETDDRYVESEMVEGGRMGKGADQEGQYHVFCTDFDRLVAAKDLYRIEQRRKLRGELDRMIIAQAVSISRLAQRLQYLFALPHRSGWHDGEEEGYLDGRRLSQLVTKPGYYRIFKQEKLAPHCDTVVSFLIDNSGSMKRQRFQAVAIMVDIYCRALELAGVSTEILGFTTAGWAGGESIKVWRKSGSPEYPGRLNDRLHIVYKDAETSWRRSRYSISSLMNPIHFKEGLDGEALQWAEHRLLNRVESRKCLVMISDGAPMESATSNHNDPFYLERHLKQVASRIERTGQIELKAISAALDMDEFFSESISLDLSGTLGYRVFSSLELLFGARHAPYQS